MFKNVQNLQEKRKLPHYLRVSSTTECINDVTYKNYWIVTQNIHQRIVNPLN
jgi:hypothetical protein